MAVTATPSLAASARIESRATPSDSTMACAASRTRSRDRGWDTAGSVRYSALCNAVTEGEDMSKPYAVISSDCHGGAQLLEYRDYLPSSLYDDFDVWARDYAIPFEDLRGPDADQNWSSERRLKEMDAEGVAGEV